MPRNTAEMLYGLCEEWLFAIINTSFATTMEKNISKYLEDEMRTSLELDNKKIKLNISTIKAKTEEKQSKIDEINELLRSNRSKSN